MLRYLKRPFVFIKECHSLKVHADNIARISSLEFEVRKVEWNSLTDDKLQYTRKIEETDPSEISKFIEAYKSENELCRNQKIIQEDKAKTIFTSSGLITAVGAIVVGGILKNGSYFTNLMLSLSIVSLCISLIGSIWLMAVINQYCSVLLGDKIGEKDQNGIQVRILYLEFNYAMNQLRAKLNKTAFIFLSFGVITISTSIVTYIWTQKQEPIQQAPKTQPVDSVNSQKMNSIGRRVDSIASKWNDAENQLKQINAKFDSIEKSNKSHPTDTLNLEATKNRIHSTKSNR